MYPLIRRTLAVGLQLATAVALVTTPAAPAGAAQPSSMAPAAAAGSVEPIDLDRTGTFVDTFAGSANTDPLYGLNVGLDTRQTGSTHASYTRLSGSWNSAQAPRPWATQVNHGNHPNRLTMWGADPTAVMLGAPAVADAGGHYTVRTVVDPVVGDTTSGDWASIMLGRSRQSWGYVTNSDIDLGLVVRSNGGLSVYSRGSNLWSGGVPAASQYQVSLTVSTGGDRAVVLVVNGTTFTVTTAATNQRWPSSAYLYLGSYLAATGGVTAFGSGQPGEGLSVSSVDATVIGSAQVFVDTFDGATDDSAQYGLNDSRRARQSAAVANSYTRTSGLWNSSTAPSAWASQVNHGFHPDKLSFWYDTSAIRADKPLVVGLDGSYAAHAVLDPIAGDTSRNDWSSLMLSASGTSNGWVTGTDVALGLAIRSTGGVQVYQGGTATFGTEPKVNPAADGSFAVTVTARPAERQVVIVINGTPLTVTTTNPLPTTAYLSLGAYIDDGTSVSTVDDLRMSKLGRLTQYGYFNIQNNGHNNHTWQVEHYTNANVNLTPPESGWLDYCRPRSCMPLTEWNTFTTDPTGARDRVLRTDLDTSLPDLRTAIGGNLDKLAALYMIDEPYQKDVPAAEVQAAADALRRYFPGQPLVLTYGGPSVDDPGTDVPTSVDMVGFDWYCESESSLRQTLNLMDSKLRSPAQQMYLVPESRPADCPGKTDADIAGRQDVYLGLANGNPKVAWMLNWGWWLERNGPEDDPFTRLPQTSAKQQAIGRSIIGQS